MTIVIFTEGTILMHKNALEHDRLTIVQQVVEKEPSIKNYAEYVPIGNAPEKLRKWYDQGAKIIYLTSRRNSKEINEINAVLHKYNFPAGILEYRKENEEYRHVAERVLPDILIEDDCESIGGEKEMTITHIKPEIKEKIKSIVANFVMKPYHPKGMISVVGQFIVQSVPCPLYGTLSR